MKKIRLIALGVFLIFGMFLVPKNAFAETIYNTGITLKNYNNTAVLYQGGIDHTETNIAYTTGKIEIPFGTSVAYNNMYTFTMTYYFWIPYDSNYQNFGLGSPELYISYNGLHQQALNVSTFTNTLFDTSTLYVRYKLILSFTFSSNTAGTLYLAIPVSPARAIYGWQYGNIDLTSFGSNGTDNSQIITNNNYNTNRIIDNNWGNTNRIIENQNNTTQQIIESNKACTKYDKNNVQVNGKKFDSNGTLINANSFNGVSDYINVSDSKLSILTGACSTSGSCIPYYVCFYSSDKTLISCTAVSNNTGEVSLPANAYYMRYDSDTEHNYPTYSLCGNGNQILNNSINDMNNTLNNDNVDNATIEGTDFFSNFQSNSHGLSGLITSPLRLLNALSTAQCSPLEFQLPFVHNQVSLACPRAMYENYFGVFFSLWQLITTGLISYNICINIYHKIHLMQNPYNDRIEVLNL